MVFGLFRRRSDETAAALYRLVVEQARSPVFYTDFFVPDTVEGRFELIVLHCGLLVARLGRDPGTRETGRELAETFFADMDRTLREMGIGDVTVPKKMRRIADAFYGRLTAYEAAGSGPALVEAVARNVYDDAPPQGVAEDLAAYLAATMAALAAADAARLAAGEIPWPAPARGPSQDAPRGGTT
jgi:cytochrome b pre-mRNA-processing protein 3